MPEVFSLACGLRVAAHHRPGAPVDYLGAAIDAGSRDELPGQEGLAHFVEHTIFKGTARRRPWHIINRMEAVGGELNAYTTKEETMVYTVAPRGNTARAADLLADLLTSASFPARELDLEREVVIDEINSYLDTPAESCFDDFDEIIFSGSPLAHNILGTPQAVRSFTTAHCRAWLERHYHPGRMVLFYSGAMAPGRLQATLERAFPSSLWAEAAGAAPPRTASPPQPAEPSATSRQQGLHQAHTVIGWRVPPASHPGATPLALLNNIIGGPGMNALLNLELRERRGLVYSVDSSATLYSDCGVLSIYLGCDPADTRRCIDLALRTVAPLAADALSERRLQGAKRQYCGQLVVGSQNVEQSALGLGHALLRGLPMRSLQQAIAEVQAVTPAHLLEAARYISPSQATILTLC